MLPPAPVTFSTMTGWPSVTFICSARMRPMVSGGPPGLVGAMSVMGWVGKVCASAPAIVAARRIHASTDSAFTSRSTRSLRLDAGLADDRTPFVHLGFQIGREAFRSLPLGRRHFHALIRDPLTHRRIGHGDGERVEIGRAHV